MILRWHNRPYYLIVIKGKRHDPKVLDVYPVATRKAALDDLGYLRRAGHRVEVREFGDIVKTVRPRVLPRRGRTR